MAIFTKEELLKIAHLSALTLEEEEVELFTEQITSILSYVDQLQHINLSNQARYTGNINILRDDIAIKTDSGPLLEQAPEIDENYFAVPKILDEK